MRLLSDPQGHRHRHKSRLSDRPESCGWPHRLSITHYLTNRVRLSFPTRAGATGYCLFKMSAVCVYSMCVRASRGLLKLRTEVSASAAAGLVRRNLSVEPGKGNESSGATEGLAQAILHQRLQVGSRGTDALFTALTFISNVHILSKRPDINTAIICFLKWLFTLTFKRCGSVFCTNEQCIIFPSNVRIRIKPSIYKTLKKIPVMIFRFYR